MNVVTNDQIWDSNPSQAPNTAFPPSGRIVLRTVIFPFEIEENETISGCIGTE